MRIISIAMVFYLTACAVVTPAQNSHKEKNNLANEGLAAKELLQGECGVFLWTRSVPRVFSFFQKQGSSDAVFYTNEEEIKLSTQKSTHDLQLNTYIDVEYISENRQPITLKAVLGEELNGGRRIPSGTIHTKDNNGWDKVTPVSGVYVCQ